MDLGLTRSVFKLTALCVCVLSMPVAASAMMIEEKDPSYWSAQWQQVATWWKPKSDKDRWRAFQPTKQTNTRRWWEESLDDHLWNSKDVEVPLDKPDTSKTTQSHKYVSSRPVLASERAETNSSKTEIEPGTPGATTVKATDIVSGQLTFIKGEINSFVEPDPAAYYRSSGESYGDNFWDYSYSHFYQDHEPMGQEATKTYIVAHDKEKRTGDKKKVHGTQHGMKTAGDGRTRSHASENNKKISDEQGINKKISDEQGINKKFSDEQGINKKFSDEQEINKKFNGDRKNNKLSARRSRKSDENDKTARSIGSRRHKTSADASVLAETVSSAASDKVGGEPAKHAGLSEAVDVRRAGRESSNKITWNETAIPNQVIKVSNINVDVPQPDAKEQEGIGPSQHRAGESSVGNSTSVYGKGERLGTSRTGLVPLAHITHTTRKSGEETARTRIHDFVDWSNWDDSAFSYYDNEDDYDESSEEDTKNKKGNGTVSDREFSRNDHADKGENDNDDDYYDSGEDDGDLDDDNDDDNDDDDDDEEDDDDDDSHDDDDDDHEVFETDVKDKHRTLADTLLKNVKIQSGKKSGSTKPAKRFDLHPANIQADEASSHTHSYHFSEGDTYYPSYSHHKPSVKKDLTNPANMKKVKKATKSLLDAPRLNLPDKRQLSQSYFHPHQAHTESNSSTSPPLVMMTAGNESAANSPAAGPTPDTNMGGLNKIVADIGKENTEVNKENIEVNKENTEINKGFILSFPLEFCKVDNDCHAGRMCVLGVCKCYTASMCIGQHKPVCGSDGLQYPSHCELHRVACVNRIHIRTDRRGKCFKEDIQEKEKSWLMEQEKLVQENTKNPGVLTDERRNVSIHEIYPFPQDIKNDSPTSDIKKAPAIPRKTVMKETGKSSKKKCTLKEMADFKEALLMFYCQKFVEPNCKQELLSDREYLSMLMFSYYDKDYDYFLMAKELDDKERDEHFTSNIIINCHLQDFIKYADNLQTDGKLTILEFTSAFEGPVSTNPPHLLVEVVLTVASAGSGLELKCGISATNVTWKRHDIQLSDDKHSHQLMVFDDGALFFSTVGLEHIGNFTCMDANDESKAQIHTVKVQSTPVVEVTPVVQAHVTGSDIELKCHAEGVPKPIITWKLGGETLPDSPHTTRYYGGGHIVIHNAQFDADAGTYTCSAHNQAGTSEKSVSVSVLPPSASSSKESPKEVGSFVVFHAHGISAYDPLQCLLRHQVLGDFGNFKYIPDVLDAPLHLCLKRKECLWGGAVRVGSEFIYVSQPDQSRVLLVHVGDILSPLQVIDTDKQPEKLWYVKHLDQVWVLCGNRENGSSRKTVVVIRDASQHIQHRSVHTQPVGNHFDMVQDLFIAPENDLQHEFDFGYVSHPDQKGLFKLKLEDMSYVKTIDLNNYGCVPTNIAFVPIGGHIVIQCVSVADQHTLQLVMDYLTDAITSTTSLNGHPMSSPDSRHLVTVDQFTGKVTVTSVSDEGLLETTYDVTVSAGISDVAFVPAISHQGYDLVLTSADDDDVIIMNLVTGKVEKIPGSQYSDHSISWLPSPSHRQVVSGGSMSSYLMAPSRSSLAILDIKFKHVECEFLEDVSTDVIIYIPSSYTR